MLIPRRVKYRKSMRGRMKGAAKGGTEIAFGRYGLQALGNAWISQRQIEACRITLTRFIKKGGKIWINLVADKPISKKPAETRMGKGKGDTAYWACVVRRGRVMFEIEGVSPQDAHEALRLASHKLPIRTQQIEREAASHG